MASPIPALIVSGYLGSGKTTLVGRLLDEARARSLRLAIVSNEFGDTGIDRALLDAGEDGFVELDGGCVCCRLSDALGETVAGILDRARPDRLVLETSGVALPGEIVVQFWRPPIEGRVSEVAIAVVVDAERLLRGDTDETFDEQLEAADLVVLNKVDLVDPAELPALEATLGERTGGQPVIRTVRGDAPFDVLFPPDVDGDRRQRQAAVVPHAHDHERFETEELRFEGVEDGPALIARLAALDAIRCKGFVRTAGGPRVVQGVGARIELTEPVVPIRPDLLGRVVVIRKAP